MSAVTLSVTSAAQARPGRASVITRAWRRFTCQPPAMKLTGRREQERASSYYVNENESQTCSGRLRPTEGSIIGTCISSQSLMLLPHSIVL